MYNVVTTSIQHLVVTWVSCFAKHLFLIGQMGGHLMDRDYLFKSFSVDNVDFVKNLAKVRF